MAAKINLKSLFTLSLSLLLCSSLLLPIRCSKEETSISPHRSFYMGFTPFPWDFSMSAVLLTQKWITQNGDIVSHHLEQGVPWTEALENKPFHSKMQEDWQGRKNASRGKKIFLSLTPLNEGRKGMDLYRGEKDDMPLPESFQGKALNDPQVKKAYLNYCLRAVKYFEPDYLAITIEANELYINAPDQWEPFLELYQETYQAIKKTYPDLPVFATLSLHNLTNPQKNPQQQQKVMQEFIRHMDIVGISYYPFMAGQSEHPTGIFDWLRTFTDKPIAITETGYPAETIRLETYHLTIPGSPKLQETYYQTLLDRAQQDGYLFVISFLCRDYDDLWERIKDSSPEAFKVWKDCGLLDEKGTTRPAYNVWKKFYRSEYRKETPIKNS